MDAYTTRASFIGEGRVKIKHISTTPTAQDVRTPASLLNPWLALPEQYADVLMSYDDDAQRVRMAEEITARHGEQIQPYVGKWVPRPGLFTPYMTFDRNDAPNIDAIERASPGEQFKQLREAMSRGEPVDIALTFEGNPTPDQPPLLRVAQNPGVLVYARAPYGEGRTEGGRQDPFSQIRAALSSSRITIGRAHYDSAEPGLRKTCDIPGAPSGIITSHAFSGADLALGYPEWRYGKASGMHMFLDTTAAGMSYR
jgi:hypothetical protein